MAGPLLLALLLPTVSAFNLEPQIAIIKRGQPGSYFGYSVAQHQILDRDQLASVALVGAPADNSSQPGTLRWESVSSKERCRDLNTLLRWDGCCWWCGWLQPTHSRPEPCSIQRNIGANLFQLPPNVPTTPHIRHTGLYCFIGQLFVKRCSRL